MGVVVLKELQTPKHPSVSLNKKYQISKSTLWKKLKALQVTDRHSLVKSCWTELVIASCYLSLWLLFKKKSFSRFCVMKGITDSGWIDVFPVADAAGGVMLRPQCHLSGKSKLKSWKLTCTGEAKPSQNSRTTFLHILAETYNRVNLPLITGGAWEQSQTLMYRGWGRK